MGSTVPTTPTVTTSGGFAWKWWICILLLLATTLNYMDRQALYQTSVRISRDFRLTNTEYGWIETAFNVGFGLGALLIGWLVDKGNVRWIYAGVVLIWSLVGFATGFVTSFLALLLCRLFLGLFESGNWPCGILTIKRVLKPEERSLGNGMFQSGTALGAIITPLVVLACIRYVDPQEPARAAGQFMAGGAAGVAAIPIPEYSWQLPFRVIGLIGLLWVILWLATVRSHHVRYVEPPKETSESHSYWEIWKDRRFWILIVVILSVNITWRSYSVWLPKFLVESAGYPESQMQWFMSLYFLGADAGSITVGFMTLFLARRGWTVHGARMWTFACCSALALHSIAGVLLPRGVGQLSVLVLIGFGALGMFPTYFALSQEISARHQGKVTGTLGCINAFLLAIVFPLQGKLIDMTKSFSLALGLAGIPPLIALVVVLRFWHAGEAPSRPTK